MLRINEDYIIRNILDEVVIVPVRCPDNNTDFYTLNESGAIIISAIADGADKNGAVEAICEKYEAEAAEVEADVDEFISQFIRLGVLTEM